MVFPMVMYGCESWTVKKAECQRIDAFELWYWKSLLRVPWTARRSNQFILTEISPGCSLEGLMLKLKLQSFGHLMQRADLLEKTLMLGNIEGSRIRDNKSLLQHHSSKASILQCSAFFIDQLLHSYMTTGKTIALTKVHLVKAMVFPVVMYGCESWTVKKAEC